MEINTYLADAKASLSSHKEITIRDNSCVNEVTDTGMRVIRQEQCCWLKFLSGKLLGTLQWFSPHLSSFMCPICPLGDQTHSKHTQYYACLVLSYLNKCCVAWNKNLQTQARWIQHLLDSLYIYIIFTQLEEQQWQKVSKFPQVLYLSKILSILSISILCSTKGALCIWWLLPYLVCERKAILMLILINVNVNLHS